MSTAAATASAAPSRSTRWIHGPLSDVLLGCGGLYLLAFFVLPLVRGPASDLGLYPMLPLVVLPLLTLLVSVPHYGGTLVRVYEQREERRRYVVFTVYATLVLCAWFVGGVYNGLLGSWMVTLNLTWSPWHYSGQNYGLALMFLRRNGVDPSPLAKRALWASFLLSFSLTALTAHGAAVVPGAERAFIDFIPIGLPKWLLDVGFPLVLALYGTSLAVAGWTLSRAGSVRAMLPAMMLVVTQAAWFVVPYAGAHFGLADPTASGVSYLTRSLLWVAMAHAAQYLWITSYYARHSEGWSGRGGYYAKVLMAGSLVWTVPLVLFSPYALGTQPFAAGLPLLVSALVNLHHFVLDGAIWRLRSGPVASILIRNRSEQAPAPTRGQRPSLLKRAVWGTALACVGAQAFLYAAGDSAFHVAVDRGHVRVAETLLSGTGWLGSETAERRMIVGSARRRQGDLDRALANFRRAVEISPRSPWALQSIGEISMQQGRARDAADAYRQALEITPSSAALQLRLGGALAELGRTSEAIAAYRRAIELRPRIPTAHVELASLLLREDSIDEAIAVLKRAVDLQLDLPRSRSQLEATLRLQQMRASGDAQEMTSDL